LCSRLGHVGTISEGPEYFLQLVDPEDLYNFPEGITCLLKGEGVASWQHDEALHPLLGCKVIVAGMSRRIAWRWRAPRSWMITACTILTREFPLQRS
jgi:hypothetical protein